ncbi:MAG: hypothetical protein ACE5J3_09730 [Methanosarcinales archaeon]
MDIPQEKLLKKEPTESLTIEEFIIKERALSDIKISEASTFRRKVDERSIAS